MVSESQKKASKKYFAKLDIITIRLPAGSRALIQKAASERGLSMNEHIKRLLLSPEHDEEQASSQQKSPSGANRRLPPP